MLVAVAAVDGRQADWAFAVRAVGDPASRHRPTADSGRSILTMPAAGTAAVCWTLLDDICILWDLKNSDSDKKINLPN
jgi:hypothetical protein